LVGITVSVHLHTTLQRPTPNGLLRHLQVVLPHGSALADLLERLAIPRRDDFLLLVVNGRQADATHVLDDMDEVDLIPALSGGAPA
jgi:molybdopterin converting factor small subunit